ncbi:hypothetical protein [Faecalibacter rhinopitheci]|uniref:Uncharacterized protein n=1 Tax=Faecalibacter rhinopitheci TaxID=2779678 RepID=A0A8J7FMG5_9FLAO|nr:hypothetical protein [Faecalibacter rhinopitheci]MBF0597082.1 hypothetical protein [Faecalibacter rhinopitheci]MBQ0148899.1 hypothetical protein [Candidatus Onthonaster equi]
MGKEFIKLTLIYSILVLLVGALHFWIVSSMNLSENPPIVYKIYIILGIITFMILQAGFLVKVKSSDFVGFTFMGGMIAKMAITLALIIVNEQIKSNVLHLVLAYFVILSIEVLMFLRLIKLDLKKF